MNIGENIKRYRKKKGFTQKELAKALDVTTITIQNYENNRREPNTGTLENIAEALDVPFAYLILDEEKSTTIENFFEECKNAGELPIEKFRNIITDTLTPQNLANALSNGINKSKELIIGSTKESLKQTKDLIIEGTKEVLKESKEYCQTITDILVFLGLNGELIDAMYRDEIEELIKFLKIATKIKYEEIVSERENQK